MKFALVNPNWSFNGSIYFGCREPHLPLEFGYSKALLENQGHETTVIDGQLFELSLDAIARQVAEFGADVAVLTTAPSYLFWRCPPPELRVPQELAEALRPHVETLVAVGPHASATPRATLAKLDVDIVVMGECEEVLPRLAADERQTIAGIAYTTNGNPTVQGDVQAADLAKLPALHWPDAWIRRHRHHHHRFDREPSGPGAEMETSRGCPYHCSFCAKIDFRDRYRRRPLDVIAEELDGLLEQGVEYIYFIDEIFLPNRELLQLIEQRRIQFGIQTRLDLWKPELIELLGRAGCVSIEAGVESLSVEGRAQLDKNCRMETEQLTQRLLLARQHVPFVQANLIRMEQDDLDVVRRWRERLQSAGVWANDPVPLFPYPSSPDYRKLWGVPDDHAWERALKHYLQQFDSMSELQEERPLPLDVLEHEWEAQWLSR
jgi:B12-binding domain/radical SAM domain protein of rhizo-twelve system